jgi:hypothetical protein
MVCILLCVYNIVKWDRLQNNDIYIMKRKIDSPDDDLGNVETCSATSVRNKQILIR